MPLQLIRSATGLTVAGRQDGHVSPPPKPGATRNPSPKSAAKRPSSRSSSEKQEHADEYSVYYELGSDVFAYWSYVWYVAKIIQVDECVHPLDKEKQFSKQRLVPCYLVHYCDFSSKFDEWIMSDSLMTCTDETRVIAAKDNDAYLSTINSKGKNVSSKAVKNSRSGRKIRPRRNKLQISSKPRTSQGELLSHGCCTSSVSATDSVNSTRETRSSLVALNRKLAKQPASAKTSGKKDETQFVDAGSLTSLIVKSSLKCSLETSHPARQIPNPLAGKTEQNVAAAPKPWTRSTQRSDVAVRKPELKVTFKKRTLKSGAIKAASIVKRPSRPVDAAQFSLDQAELEEDLRDGAVTATALVKCKMSTVPTATGMTVQHPPTRYVVDESQLLVGKIAAHGVVTADVVMNEPTSIDVPELQAQPFFKTFSQFAVRGLSLLTHPALQKLGVHRLIVVPFAFPNFTEFLTSVTPSTAILVRFCRYPSTAPSAESHPKDLKLTLNERDFLEERVPWQNLPESSNAASIHQRFFPAIQIPVDKLREKNVLTVEWTAVGKPAEDFLIFVERAERKSMAVVKEELRSQQVPMSESITKLYEQLTVMKMNKQGQSRICSLVCPLTKQRFVNPVRGKDCQHVACFDADSYVNANRGGNVKPSWTCPICGRLALLDDLIGDEFSRLMLEFTENDGFLAQIQDGQRDLVIQELNGPSRNLPYPIGTGSASLPEPSPLLDSIPVEMVTDIWC